MAELHIGSQGVIKFTTYSQGEFVDSASITASVKPGPTTAIPNPTSTSLTVINDDVNEGSYYAYVPMSLTLSGEAKYIDFYASYTIPGNSTQSVINRRYYLVRPYAAIDEVIEACSFGLDKSDPNHKTYDEVAAAERYARYRINAYTGQRFDASSKTVEVLGDGTDTILLPERVESISKVTVDDVVVFSDTISNYTFTITPTNHAIRVDKPVGIEAFETYPYTEDIAEPAYFKRGKRYAITGVFGYENIPSEIYEATILLANDFFHQDTVWKNKYIKRMQTGDWNIELSGQAFTGTGNATADRILEPFIANRMVVI